MTKAPTILDETLLDAVVFDRDGLVPAVAQQYDSGEVLMLAWMNREALTTTLHTGEAHYWSRSRRALWRKGEQSGQTQRLVELRLDCDGDAVLLLVDQTGVACHTGRQNCFFRVERHGRFQTVLPVTTDPAALYRESKS